MMRTSLRLFVLLVLMCSALAPTGNALALQTVPTFVISAVVPNASITIQASNFPANTAFDVLMSPFSTKGVNGIKAGQITSGPGGAFMATFSIPVALQGEYQIAVRLQASADPNYYVFNWFYNNRFNDPNVAPPLKPSTGGAQAAAAKPLPTFNVTNVVANKSITVTTYNFPANDKMEVLMGLMGTRGIGGVSVATVTTGKGGTLTYHLNIPASLVGQYQIAIRFQSITGRGYFAYNWFVNADTWGPPPPPGPGTPQPQPGYGLFPTFSVINVQPDGAVAIMAYNLPKNKPFQATMGLMGTRGMNGIVVSSFNTGAGGMQAFTFAIPSALFGANPISLRLQATDGSGYYAYNWFYNR